MPELPEVETVVRELRPRLVGRRFTRVAVSRKALRRDWRAGWRKALCGCRVRAIRRRGKWIVMELLRTLSPPGERGRGEGVRDAALFLVIHLGMTGQLTVVPARTPVAKHTHLTIDLEKGRRQLRFRDIRRFGSATVFSAAELEQFFRDTDLGPEPFDVTLRYWSDRLAATRRSLKALLLDQRVVAGVGNIYADEALFEARLHPARLACSLRPAEVRRLRKAVTTVLARAIAKRGSSIRDYVGGSGVRGAYQDEFRVYARFDGPCGRCGVSIQRIVLAGRSTHFCPRCQPESISRAVAADISPRKRRNLKVAASAPVMLLNRQGASPCQGRVWTL